MSEANLSLKVLINKHKSKVLFAEANNHVVDVLFSFLALPLGKIVRNFEKHYGSEAPVIGSLTTLYKGLLNLDIDHFSCKGAKGMLVNPKSSLESECRRLILDITDSQPPEYFVCQDYGCEYPAPENISLFPDVLSCDCGEMLSTKKTVGERLEGAAKIGIFTRNAPDSFIISDDLRVLPNSNGIVQTLNDLGITDTDGEELRSLSLGIKNIMDLLKCALISTTPLTDLFINSGEIRPSPAESQPGILLKHIKKETVSDDAKRMILKVTLQKSTNKFLYAHGKGESCFVDSAREYIVSDDLTVTPYSVAAIVSILNAQGVSSLLDVREVELNVGVEEALIILKASLTSTTALTDAFNLIDPMLKIIGRVEEFEDSEFDNI